MHRLQKDLCCAVVIDVQEKLFPHIQNHETLLKSQSILLQGLQLLEVPILVTEQYVKGLGATLQELKKLLPQEQKYFEKMCFSCQGAQNFSEALDASARNTVILLGIEAHVCVLQTALDLLDKGFRVVIVEDCIGSRKNTDKETALARLRQAGAVPSSYESILLELCSVSGTELFKQISKLIK